MPRIWHSRPWRIGRICFRWLRITCWLIVLAVLGSLVYLNQVGIPAFLKDRLVEELHSRGLDFEFRQMRLDFYGGIVAEDVRFGAVNHSNAPAFSVASVGLQINTPLLWRQHRLEVETLLIHGGRLTLPLFQSNAPPLQLAVEDIDARISLLSGDLWHVHELTARSLGARFNLAGNITNASALQDFAAESETTKGRAVWRNYLRQVVEASGRLHFRTRPELRGRWSVDATAPMKTLASIELRAGGVETPWGEAEDFRLHINSIPAVRTNDILGASLELHLGNAATRWGRARELTLQTKTRPLETPGAVPGGGLHIEATEPRTPWGDATRLTMDLTLSEMQTNFTGLRGQLQLSAEEPRTRWASARTLQITAHGGQLRVTEVMATDPTWGWWGDLAPYELDWALVASDVTAKQGELRQLEARGHWRAPDLAIDELRADLTDGRLTARAEVDVERRDALASVAIDFDVKKLDRLLSTNAMKWLQQFHWDKPPVAQARGGVHLPPWNAVQPDWRGEVVPSLWLEGTLTNQSGAYRGVTFDRARLDFKFTNQTWFVSNLRAERPEGRVLLDHVSDERTRDYSFRINSSIDPQALRGWLDDGGKRTLDFFKFSAAPLIDGDLWGRWRAPERTGFRAMVSATNLTFRGERIDSFSGRVTYTNRVVHFSDARVTCPEGELSAPAGRYDIAASLLYLTNAVSTVDPGMVLRPIGPRTAETMEPYRFLKPPKVLVNGIVNTRDVAGMDLRFHVEGGPFHWSRFRLPQVVADVHWVTNQLILSNVTAGFYDGRMTGAAWFDFRPPQGTTFAFTTDVWEADLRKFMADISTTTNKVEGVLNGRLEVTRADSWDWESWQGRGHASLRDGLIWDAPLFGFLSTPLNLVAPGLGNSRASAATANFTITNSLIHTSDLDIVANSLRLYYRGTVDFETRVNARVEVEFLRDTGLLGRFVNIALMPLTKLFEYKVTGTLAKPNPEPLYMIPKLILFPLAPIKTIKEIIPGGDSRPAAPPPASAKPNP